MKHAKLWIYGDPGTGKSVFAYRLGDELKKIENTKKGAFFITTDGNYEWLEDFGAKPEDSASVASWKEFKKVVGSPLLDDYGTIVVDLVEDLYKWAQQEFCIANNLEYIGDASMGKGWAIVSDDYTSVLTKLINFNKHIIFISHGDKTTVKNNRGIESTYYFPTSKRRAKDCDTLEGRMRFVLRCYNEEEVVDDSGVQRIVTKRYLSVTPKPEEFSIFRGADVDKLPARIPLEPLDFIRVSNLARIVENKPATKAETAEEFVKAVVGDAVFKSDKVPAPKAVPIPNAPVPAPKSVPIPNAPVPAPKSVLIPNANPSDVRTFHAILKPDYVKPEPINPVLKPDYVKPEPIPTKEEQIKKAEDVIAENDNFGLSDEDRKAIEKPAPTKELTPAERIAALKAKFASVKKN